jgi:hypothetical protein
MQFKSKLPAAIVSALIAGNFIKAENQQRAIAAAMSALPI